MLYDIKFLESMIDDRVASYASSDRIYKTT